jgi:uncharacterized membrane protein
MLSSPISFIFFAIFAAILVGMYLSIRREWAPTGLVTAVGLVGSIISMLIVSLSQDNQMFQAIVVSLGLGTVFSLATAAVAIFFHTNELRENRINNDLSTVAEDTE